MAKYTYEFKKKVVDAYNNGEGGYWFLANKFGLSDTKCIRQWVANYNSFGDEGLHRSRKNEKYTFEKKLSVVELYLSSEISYKDLALQEGITNSCMISKWVNRFRIAGPDALRPHKKGRKKTLDKIDSNGQSKHIEVSSIDTSAEHKDYGYRRILGELRNQGYTINKKKVQRIIQKLGLQVTSYTRKSRKYSSYRGKVGTVAPNRIRRRFNTHIPHQKITTDTTEFKYYELDKKGHMTVHKLYLDPFMDMCNGEILSYGIDKKPSAKNVMDALEKAIEITSDCPYRRTFHSDQGWAYQMKAYSHRLESERIFQSMSRKGNCLDNSIMENFFGLLKQEIYYGVIYSSYGELKTAIEQYIKYYNEQRIKEKLGWLSPVQYRLSLQAA